ncbi:MAG: sulfotransferase [Congregibacter sp.]
MTALAKALRTGPYKYQRFIPPLPRRFQAYTVGTSKSGTHSLYAMVSSHYRSGHEAEYADLIHAILDLETGARSPEDTRAWLRQRDQQMCLEMDSSALNAHVIGELAEAFPKARFILTLRDCYSWLDSVTNHIVTRPGDPVWQKLKERPKRRGTDEYTPEEAVLKEHGLSTLDRALSLWADHNATVIEKVPADRLLVVRTEDISSSVERIADFLGVSVASLQATRSHAFKRQTSVGLAAAIDRDFLESRVNEHCRDLMDEFFPKLKRFEDAVDVSSDSAAQSAAEGTK